MRVVFQASTGKNLLGKEYGKFLRTDKHLASVSAGLRSHNLSQLVNFIERLGLWENLLEKNN